MGIRYSVALAAVRPPLSATMADVYTRTPAEVVKCLPTPINPNPETYPEPLRQTETSE